MIHSNMLFLGVERVTMSGCCFILFSIVAEFAVVLSGESYQPFSVHSRPGVVYPPASAIDHGYKILKYSGGVVSIQPEAQTHLHSGLSTRDTAIGSVTKPKKCKKVWVPARRFGHTNSSHGGKFSKSIPQIVSTWTGTESVGATVPVTATQLSVPSVTGIQFPAAKTSSHKSAIHHPVLATGTQYPVSSTTTQYHVPKMATTTQYHVSKMATSPPVSVPGAQQLVSATVARYPVDTSRALYSGPTTGTQYPVSLAATQYQVQPKSQPQSAIQRPVLSTGAHYPIVATGAQYPVSAAGFKYRVPVTSTQHPVSAVATHYPVYAFKTKYPVSTTGTQYPALEPATQVHKSAAQHPVLSAGTQYMVSPTGVRYPVSSTATQHQIPQATTPHFVSATGMQRPLSASGTQYSVAVSEVQQPGHQPQVYYGGHAVRQPLDKSIPSQSQHLGIGHRQLVPWHSTVLTQQKPLDTRTGVPSSSKQMSNYGHLVSPTVQIASQQMATPISTGGGFAKPITTISTVSQYPGIYSAAGQLVPQQGLPTIDEGKRKTTGPHVTTDSVGQVVPQQIQSVIGGTIFRSVPAGSQKSPYVGQQMTSASAIVHATGTKSGGYQVGYNGYIVRQPTYLGQESFKQSPVDRTKPNSVSRIPDQSFHSSVSDQMASRGSVPGQLVPSSSLQQLGYPRKVLVFINQKTNV